MIPAFWLTIRLGKIQIPLLLPLVLPLALVIEILAFLPVTIYATRKKKPFLLRIATHFYLSRLMFALILRGRGFKVGICDGGNRIQIAGRWKVRPLPVS